MTLDDWVGAHPYLAPVAALHAAMDAAIAQAMPIAGPADFSGYRADFLQGVPLLHSDAAGIDLTPAGPGVAAVIAAVANAPLAPELVAELRALHVWLADARNGPHRLVDWLIDDEAWHPPNAGLLRCVGWRALAASLTPVLHEFSACRDDQSWLRRYCPACGCAPAMAQLIGVDPGRERYLRCGCCGTSWRFARTRCPFCEVETHTRATVTVDDDPRLRIDYCESCGGYLKTYAGHGDEAVLLADWTTLHLELAAAARGWRRAAVSLYEIDRPDEAPPLYSGDSGNPDVTLVR